MDAENLSDDNSDNGIKPNETNTDKDVGLIVGLDGKRKLASQRERFTKAEKVRKTVTAREKKRHQKLANRKNKQTTPKTKQRAQARKWEKFLRQKLQEQMKEEVTRYLAELDDKNDFQSEG